MSRARVVCSKILNKISNNINQIEQLTVLSDQQLIDKLSDYNLNNSNQLFHLQLQDNIFLNNLNSDFNLIEGGNNRMKKGGPEESKKIVDSWLDKNNLAMADDFLGGAGLEVKGEKMEISPEDNLVLESSVDPLLNVPGEVTKDLTNSDCDTIIYKTKIWDTLSIASRKSDSDKNSDFIDFNMLPYNFDTTDLIEHEKTISTNTVTYEFESETPFENILIQDTAKLSSSKEHETKTKKLNAKINNIKQEKTIDIPIITDPLPNPIFEINSAADLQNASTNSSDSFNLIESVSTSEILIENSSSVINLKSDQVVESLIASEDGTKDMDSLDLNLKEGQFSKHAQVKIKVPEIANMLGQVALVSNSTVNKSKPRTKLLIKTDKGDEKYEGNTADLMLPLNNQKKGRKVPAPVLGKHIIMSVETAATIREGPNTPHYKLEEDDQIIKQMLDVLGITDDMLYTVLTNQNLRIWICPEHECRKIYNRLRTLKTHILSHYGLKPFKCDYPNCPWSFYTSFKLKRHRETHLKKKNFLCSVPDCNRSFTTIYNLNSHIKLHERPARLKCLVGPCQSYFQTVRAMEKHLKTHNDCLAPYKCEYPGCEKLCYSSTALTAHTRCHNHKPEELTCDWEGCGKVFDKPCRLKAHMRQHTGDRPYVCQFKDCKWAFSSSSKLKRHQHKHFGERRFRCTIGDCTKAFMRSEHLKDHTLTHIGSKTFQCPYCDENFSAKASMYVHKKKCHSLETLDNNLLDRNLEQKLRKDPVDFNDNKSTIVKNDCDNKKLSSIILSNVNNPVIETIIEKPDNSIFENNIPPSSPSVLLSNDEYGFDSFKQEFSSLENIEPVLNPVQDEINKENSKLKNSVESPNFLKKRKSSSKALKSSVKKMVSVPTSESCARTYLAYHSDETVFDEANESEISLPDETDSASPVTVTNITDSAESVLEAASPCPSSPGPSCISDMSLSSIVDMQVVHDSEIESALAPELRDVPPLIEAAHTISLNCDTNLSNASDTEMLINYDNFQDNQQPIFFSNFILQDTDSGTDLFTTEENGEYILLLDSTSATSSSFPESTINLRDLD